MGKSRYRIWEPDCPHFVTCTVVKWLHLFSEPELVGLVLASIRHLQAGAGLRVHGYVVMTNHLHMIVSGPDWGGALARFRRFTAHEIVAWLRANGRQDALRDLSFALREGRGKQDGRREHQVWQEGVHPQKIAGEDMLRQKLDYMHANPVRQGYVDEPAAWRNSSARNYAGLSGALEIEALL